MRIKIGEHNKVNKIKCLLPIKVIKYKPKSKNASDKLNFESIKPIHVIVKIINTTNSTLEATTIGRCSFI